MKENFNKECQFYSIFGKNLHLPEIFYTSDEGHGDDRKKDGLGDGHGFFNSNGYGMGCADGYGGGFSNDEGWDNDFYRKK